MVYTVLSEKEFAARMSECDYCVIVALLLKILAMDPSSPGGYKTIPGPPCGLQRLQSHQ